MIKFNISASSLNLYLENEIEFFYSYITKSPGDAEVPQGYGKAGNIVHSVLEKVSSGVTNETQGAQKIFNKEWASANMEDEVVLFGKKLDCDKYLKAVLYGVELLNTVHNVISSEQLISFPIKNDEKAQVSVKGIIDCVCKDDKGIYIMDWKTSSLVDWGDSFKRQGLMYCYLYFLKYKTLPYKVVFEYIKIKKTKEYIFSFEDVKKFARQLDKILNEIIDKGTDISKYSISNVDGLFNIHKNKCIDELNKRENGLVRCVIENNQIEIVDKLPNDLAVMLDLKYSYFVDGYIFSQKYKKRIWDGKKHLFKSKKILFKSKKILPLAFKQDFEDVVKFYNEKTNSNILLEFTDNRNYDVLNKKFKLTFSKSKINLRYYQKEAIDIALKNKVGILYLGTGAGKTIISTELVKKIKKYTLFVVNRIELVRQTKEVYEKNLGVKIGHISEGKMEPKEINIASIQSLIAILKRKDETTKTLRKLLYVIPVCIFDEAQNVSDSKMYSQLCKYLVNLEYSVGLTGTPWRADNSTLEMNSFVGFPIYKKTTEELESEGFLCQTKCFFIKHAVLNVSDEEYIAQYKISISNNVRRNKKIVDVVKLLKNKKILIITKLVEHAKILNQMINGSHLILGETDSKSRKEIFTKFKKEGGVLVGSLKIFSAGVDIPDLDVIINASAHKSSVDSVQLIGRLKRKYNNKKFGYYIDFDDSSSFFKNSAHERKKILKSYGNTIQEIISPKEIEKYIY